MRINTDKLTRRQVGMHWHLVLVAVCFLASFCAMSQTKSVAVKAPQITAASVTLVQGEQYKLEVEGTGFAPESVIELGGVTVPTHFQSSELLTADVTLQTRAAVRVADAGSGARSAPATLKVYLASIETATRLLDQSTFGPTATDIETVRTLGVDGYLQQQFHTKPSQLAPIPYPLPPQCAADNSFIPCEESEWWQAAMTGQDQLRQRVAFALSQIFVISSDSVDARAITAYHNMLARDAFRNYNDIMQDVTLSPGMGAYLNMLNSAAAPEGQIANENYARELMQLFSIGINRLHDDGTLILDANGNPIPNYTQEQVQAFARAFTGWTYALPDNSTPDFYPNWDPNFYHPMVPVAWAHDTSSKTLLGGTVLPAGQSASEDLNGAIRNIFNHPNVGPFICKQLIQHLVTSRPSPAYVKRVVHVFVNDGRGMRGNMWAVVRAILEDPEARAGDTNPALDGGHLREPILWVANFYRTIGFHNTDPTGSYFVLSELSAYINQEPYASPSVFNFFSPQYVIPHARLNAPEFQLENTASSILRANLADYMVGNYVSGINIDLSASSTLGRLAQKSPAKMVDALSVMFMHNQMPADMKTEIVNTITGMSADQQVRVAIFLVVTSSQYKILH